MGSPLIPHLFFYEYFVLLFVYLYHKCNAEGMMRETAESSTRFVANHWVNAIFNNTAIHFEVKNN